MMRHTLKEFMNFYNDVNNVILHFADHTINIYTQLEGSMAIVRAFENFKFNLVKCDEKTIELNY